MNGKCHKLVGAVTGMSGILAISGVQGAEPAITVLGLSALAGGLGGLVPDIDKRGSKISNKARVVSTITELTCGHRGIIHTPFMLVILSIIMFVLIKKAQITNIYILASAISFILGYFSHLALDLLTPAGIMLLYPFSKKRTHIIGLKTKLKEPIICVVSLVFLVLIYTCIY